MKIEFFFWTFFQRSSRLVKVMVKLWGGMSSILIEEGQANIYPFIDFLLILLIFIYFIDFIDFIDFLWILLIFYRFYLFYWFFTDFIDFSTILSLFVGFLTSFAYFQQFLNKFSPIYRTYVFLKRRVMYNIDQVLLWGVTRPLYSTEGCFYSRNTENFLNRKKLPKSMRPYLPFQGWYWDQT